MEKVFGNILETVRVDDHVEYFLFPKIPNELLNSNDKTKELDEVMTKILAECNAFVKELTEQRNYIWQKDHFQLEIRTGRKQEKILLGQTTNEEPLPPHLYGVTHYGENISDEWFIVFLIFELTLKVPGLIGRVVDSDGEFPLIEAANVLPKWADPDSCAQRVYIVEGFLQLVQSSPCNTTRLLEVSAAVNKIRLNPTLYRVSNEIQQSILNRLKEFSIPNVNLHHQIVRLPLGVAALLKKDPQLIASAVRAFSDRDTLDLKVCRSMRFFPPEQRVRTNVRFTRCLYAMLTHSNYVPDKKTGWNLSNTPNTEEYKEDLLGIKIACGFEILASRGKENDNEREWQVYLQNLKGLGYFNKNIEGSAEYKRLLVEARSFFDQTEQRYQTMPKIGKQILDMLETQEIKIDELLDEENNLQPSESDDWLNITSEELDTILFARYKSEDERNINAEEFTKQLSEFLEKESEFDGIENDDEPITSKKGVAKNQTAQITNSGINKDNKKSKQYESHEEDANTHVRNFLDFVIPEDTWDSNSEMSDYEDEEDLERNFEAMTKTMKIDIEAYMNEMDKELAKTTIGQTFRNQNVVGKSSVSTSAPEDDFNDIETFEPVNINVNTLKNMMDSYKSQIGGAGPVSNLLTAMGVGMSSASAAGDDDTEKNRDLTESTV